MNERTDQQLWLDKAYRFLSYRPRSQHEISTYLQRKQASPQIIDSVMAKLKRQKLLDDQEFIVWWVDQRARFRPRGKRALRFELRQKGVSGPSVETVLAGLDELKLAKKALKNHARSYRQAGRFLVQRGFGWSVIRPVLEEIFPKG